MYLVSDLAGVVGLEKTTTNSRRHYDLSRQMSLLRAATTTRIDEELSPANVTAIRGETALLVCTVLNIGDKSVLKYYLKNLTNEKIFIIMCIHSIALSKFTQIIHQKLLQIVFFMRAGLALLLS